MNGTITIYRDTTGLHQTLSSPNVDLRLDPLSGSLDI